MRATSRKALAVIGLLGIVAPALPAQNTLTVEGVVVDKATGAGISGATVLGMNSVLTNEGGVFRISGLKPGDYRAFAQKQGYSGGAPLQFHVSADGSPVRLRLELIPPAILRGRVLGIDGKPAQAAVELGAGPNPNLDTNSVRTNEEGYFTFEHLEPGSYTLLGRPEIGDAVSTQEETRTEVVPTYYPSALERSQAEMITVPAGAELSGYEIRLQSAPVYRVSGVVLDPAGKPAPDAVVQLLDKVGDGLNGVISGSFVIRRSSTVDTPNATQSTTTADDGTFEFPSVRPGDWTVRVESDSIRDEIQQRDVILFGSTAFNLGRRDVDDVTIRLVAPFDLSGTVEAGDALPAIDRTAGITLTGESGYFGGSASSNVDGTLRIESVIPGRYLITAGAAGNYYASALMGSMDVTGQTVELSASSPPIRVVLKRGGTIRWTLEQPGSCTVVLMPRNLTGTGHLAYSFGGRNLELAGIPPGEYYVIAIDRFDPRTMAETPRLRALVPTATSVRVAEGSDVFVQLKINHAPD